MDRNRKVITVKVNWNRIKGDEHVCAPAEKM